MYRIVPPGAQNLDTGQYIHPSDVVEWAEFGSWSELGNVPESSYTLDQIKEYQKTVITTAREKALAVGVEFNGHMFMIDDRSRSNLIGLVSATAAGLPLPPSFVWRAMDNTPVPMDATVLSQFAAVVLSAVNSIYNTSWQLKDEVAAATSYCAALTPVWPS